MSLDVVEVGPKSAAEVLGVVRAAFADRPPLDPPADALGETEESLAELLGRRGGLLARLDGEAVGAVVLDPSEHTLYLRRFGVTPAAQGHGVAAALVERALHAAPACVQAAVMAREELPETVAFWERQDFTVASRTPPYLELRRPLPRTYDVPSAADMHELGQRLARQLTPGDLVVLTGDLGAGKTTLAQGLGDGLGVRGPITSPTFVIARVHPPLDGGPELVHVDAYRLGGAAELDDLDLDTSLGQAVTVVEWGEGLAEGLAESRLEVRIRRGVTTDDDTLDPRRVEILAIGPRWVGFTGVPV